MKQFLSVLLSLVTASGSVKAWDIFENEINAPKSCQNLVQQDLEKNIAFALKEIRRKNPDYTNEEVEERMEEYATGALSYIYTLKALDAMEADPTVLIRDYPNGTYMVVPGNSCRHFSPASERFEYGVVASQKFKFFADSNSRVYSKYLIEGYPDTKMSNKGETKCVVRMKAQVDPTTCKFSGFEIIKSNIKNSNFADIL